MSHSCPPAAQDLSFVYALAFGLVGLIVGKLVSDAEHRKPPS